MKSPSESVHRLIQASARCHVRRLKGFHLHLLPYVDVVSVLTVVNLVVSPRYLWVLWVACGWGLGLLVHALFALTRLPLLDQRWEDRQVRKYLARQT